MSETTNEMRVAKNSINIEGVLASHNLEKEKTDNKKDIIRGNFKIRTSEDNEIRVSVYTEKFNSKGEIKKTYEKLEDIIEGNYKSLANCKKGLVDEKGNQYDEQPAYVSVWGNGDFTPKIEEYIGKNGTTGIQYSLGFGNLTIDNNKVPEKPHATYSVEMFMTNIAPEYDKEQQETGRVIIKGYTVNYGGTLVPLTLIAPKTITEPIEGTIGEYEEIEWADVLLDNLDQNDTYLFEGQIVNSTIVTQTKIERLGRVKVEEKKEYINELICDFCDNELPEGNKYSVDDIREASVQREAKIQDKKNEEENKSKNNSRSGRTGLASNGRKRELPF